MSRAALGTRPGPQAVDEEPLRPQPKQMSIVTPKGLRVRIRYMFVDAAAAKLMLDANTQNRVPSQGTIDSYGRSMEDNDWEFTGDPLQFGEGDLLLNGQHRLMAIEETEVGQWLLVIGGLPNSAQDYMDGGLRRTAAGQLLMTDKLSKAGQKTAVARLYLQWMSWANARVNIKLTNAEVTRFVRENLAAIEAGLEAAQAVHGNPKQLHLGGVGGSVSKPALAAFHMRARQVSDPETVAKFMHKLQWGKDYDDDMDPTRLLRQALVNSTRAVANNDLYKLSHVWNALMDGTGVGKLQVPPKGVSRYRILDLQGPQEEDLSEARIAAMDAVERLNLEDQ